MALTLFVVPAAYVIVHGAAARVTAWLTGEGRAPERLGLEAHAGVAHGPSDGMGGRARRSVAPARGRPRPPKRGPWLERSGPLSLRLPVRPAPPRQLQPRLLALLGLDVTAVLLLGPEP